MNLKKSLMLSAHRIKVKNKCILGNQKRPAADDCVNYEWWYSHNLADCNLGDYLAVVVNNWMLEQKGLENTTSSGPRFLSSIGSVLGFCCNDVTIWGSGLLDENTDCVIRPLFKKMDIRAVRGPRTKEELERRGYTCPDVFGDPAIIMPLIYPAEPVNQAGVLYIGHYASKAPKPENIRCANILTKDYMSFIDEIVQAELVISSSLHGIILAESYGVPAILLDDGRENFSLFKYQDWYYSTGRSSFPVAHSVDEALSLTPCPLPNLEILRQKLVDAFPYDRWTE